MATTNTNLCDDCGFQQKPEHAFNTCFHTITCKYVPKCDNCNGRLDGDIKQHTKTCKYISKCSFCKIYTYSNKPFNSQTHLVYCEFVPKCNECHGRSDMGTSAHSETCPIVPKCGECYGRTDHDGCPCTNYEI
jgi:hypothetical protein